MKGNIDKLKLHILVNWRIFNKMDDKTYLKKIYKIIFHLFSYNHSPS